MPENLYTRKCINPKFQYNGGYKKIHSFHSNEASKCTYGHVPLYRNNLYIVRRDDVNLPSSLGRSLDSCMSTPIALQVFVLQVDLFIIIEVQVDLFIVFGVQVDISIVLGIQFDRFIDFGV